MCTSATPSHEYGPELTVQHKGSVNATTALNDLATQFPDAAQLVVTGESAGSVPTPLYAGLAHDLLPNAEITVLADGSGAYPDVPAINAVIGAVWGTESAIPPWPENAGLTAATWSFPALFVQAYKHDPEIIFGRHDYAFDQVQQFFAGLAGIRGRRPGDADRRRTRRRSRRVASTCAATSRRAIRTRC